MSFTLAQTNLLIKRARELRADRNRMDLNLAKQLADKEQIEKIIAQTRGKLEIIDDEYNEIVRGLEPEVVVDVLADEQQERFDIAEEVAALPTMQMRSNNITLNQLNKQIGILTKSKQGGFY